MNKLLTKDILIASSVASKSNIKPELSSVKITNDEIIATDSFKAIIIKRDDDVSIEEYPGGDKAKLSDDGVLIDATQVLKKLKFHKIKNIPILSEKAIIIEKENTVDIQTTDLETIDTVSFRKVNGNYPSFDKLIPTDEDFIKIKLSPTLLREIIGCFKDDMSIEIEVRKDKPIVIKSGNKTGLLMPMRN